MYNLRSADFGYPTRALACRCKSRMVSTCHESPTVYCRSALSRDNKMKLNTYNHFAVDQMIHDMNVAAEGWDWSKGAYGHSLSLTAPGDLHPLGRDHYNNLPFADRLNRCPYFQRIFDSFECDKASFRLLRRSAGSSYAWHTDKDKGPSVIRFQVPIVTNPESILVVTDYDEFSEIQAMDTRLSEAEAFDEYATFKRFNQGHFQEYVLEPGILYYFNTSKFHNLLNQAASVRTTLVVDCVANDWLRAEYPAIEEELDSPAAR